MRFFPRFLAFALLTRHRGLQRFVDDRHPGEKPDPTPDRRPDSSDANPKFPHMKDMPMMKDNPFQDMPSRTNPSLKDFRDRIPRTARSSEGLPIRDFPKMVPQGGLRQSRKLVTRDLLSAAGGKGDS